MIPTLLRISRTNLSRDRVALMMVFVLPIAFFSIFAAIFGRQGTGGGLPRVPVAIVDEDESESSRSLVAALRADSGLAVRDAARAAAVGIHVPLHREQALEMVRGGDVSVAIVFPRGWGRTFPDLSGRGIRAEILSDPSDPIARGAAIGLLQRAGAQRLVRAERGGSASDPDSDQAGMPVPTEVREVAGPQRRNGARMVSFYAAGIAVMFLLFSAAGAGGALLDEQDSGTLERVLGTRVGMTGLLTGKWLHVTLLGITQITVMFVWAMLAFRLDLLHHLPGFAVMTVFTAAAAAGFGLVLATLSRTRQQLMGFANIIVLSMSAMGGSMFPRFLMSPAMQKIGLLTFNAWALDGYVKVFWRDAPIAALWPQLSVLAALTVVFLATARLLARRWEAA
ncbi:MAG: ABC transporter permease [Candidatus Eisenbacteria bacterium]|nr:ABC transporter permease [Candidatus Eisenbacteria bacterium]